MGRFFKKLAEKSHDYEFEWDYEVDESPDEKLVSAFREAENKVRSEVLPKLNGAIENFEVGFVKGLGEDIAKYVDGTRSYPSIAVDLEGNVTSANKYGVGLDTAFLTTILHELGHALQDVSGREYDCEEAENFAYRYWKTGEVFRFWEESSN